MDTEFTMENVSIVAQAYADYLNESVRKLKNRPPRVVIGYDFRKNSENFSKRFAEVLLGNGIEVLSSNAACPTPAVSFTIVLEKYDGGIAITASHNPAGYNGVKIKTDFGGSAEKSITDGVESFLGKNPVRQAPFSAAAPKIRDFNERYLEHLKNYLKMDVIRKSQIGRAHV